MSHIGHYILALNSIHMRVHNIILTDDVNCNLFLSELPEHVHAYCLCLMLINLTSCTSKQIRHMNMHLNSESSHF